MGDSGLSICRGGVALGRGEPSGENNSQNLAHKRTVLAVGGGGQSEDEDEFHQVAMCRELPRAPTNNRLKEKCQ